jgi:hypothetical protein
VLPALARFLRDDEGGALLFLLADNGRKILALPSSRRGSYSVTTQGERHETPNHLATAAEWHRRPEHAGGQRRRMRCGRLPGRLRRAPRRCGCAARRRRPARRCRAPQGILILVRRILTAIALATVLLSIGPAWAQTTNALAGAISSARELSIGTKEAPPFSTARDQHRAVAPRGRRE